MCPSRKTAFAIGCSKRLFVWMKPVFDASAAKDRLRQSVEHWVGELDALARAYQKTKGLAGAEAKDARKPINGRKIKVFRNLVSRVEREAMGEIAADFVHNWEEHYRDIMTEIVTGGRGGRVRYCRQHSKAYVEYMLAGKQIPNRIDIDEADLISRKQQIVFRRLWRLVEARLLPIAGGRIDRLHRRVQCRICFTRINHNGGAIPSFGHSVCAIRPRPGADIRTRDAAEGECGRRIEGGEIVERKSWDANLGMNVCVRSQR